MNDRAVLIAAAVLAGVLICFGAFWALRDYAVPIFVNGNALARHADLMVGDMIAARFPAVRVGRVRCPALVDFTRGRSATCAVPIEGQELRVDVAVRRGGRGVEFTAVDGLFVARDGERTIGRELEQMYGEKFSVRCPGAAVRVLQHETTVSCAVEAPDAMRRGLEVTVLGDRGTVSFEELAGVPTRAARILGDAVAAQREGSVTIEGPALERYLRGSAAGSDGGEVGRRRLVGAAHCPLKVALHEGTHASCTVAVANITLRYDVHFEKGLGLRTDVDSSVAVIPALREFALRYFQRRQLETHIPYRVGVSCGAVAAVVVEPGMTVRCQADVGGEPFYFAVRILDSEGGFTLEESTGAEDTSWKEP
ncbi:MAG: hypothetical protein QOF71_1082 [Candidatus Eremiobacteraeota bacterium]|jgi:hypothetical protein|nr:hypothetical protein [Candidatus Eremiobacteraeota bacterium]